MKKKLNLYSIDQLGFSLIEVLVAFTILGFITLSMYSITDNNIATKDRVLGEDERFLNVQMALDILGRDLNHIYSPIYFSVDQMGWSSIDQENSPLEKVPIQQYSENFPSRTLDQFLIPKVESNRTNIKFLSYGHFRKVEDIKQSNYEWIEYKMISAEKKQNLIRVVEANNIYSENELDHNHEEVLIENIKSIEFSFWNKDKKKFTELSSSSQEYKNKWIAVKVILVWFDTDDSEVTEQRIYRPIWPSFDAKKDWAKRDQIKKKNKNIDKKPKDNAPAENIPKDNGALDEN